MVWFKALSNVLSGIQGEYLRRLAHVSFAAIPFFYFYALAPQVQGQTVVLHQCLLCCLAIVMMLDGSRIVFGWSIVGQRSYERDRLSSLTSLAVGVVVVLWWAPTPVIAIAIIVSAAVADPFMGVMRRCNCSALTVAGVGVVLVMVIWCGLGVWQVLPVYSMLLLAIMTVLIERYNGFWLDDNLLMQAIPLSVVLLIMHCW